MIVDWRPKGREDLWEILEYIDERNPKAADALQAEIERATSALPEHPYLYRIGRAPMTREIIVHPNYLVVYQITDRIEIVSVLHARQEYP
ncbi:type II toxin-antitoxin system RelE/ParE family toxin [Pseudomonas sp. UBA1879]|uniref:type II toxin-antitoxin system RelE/ParE family toxin n=1 Tax=Pseudomonas sp. UBA1879 TaxID=1947305 RepID=UPI0025F5B184|nr:type II toxin-antitoxin system RelE/ParE family toxin [Pseudomonas sp. UBA1879]